MKYTIKRSGRFKKDYKLSKKRGLDITLLKDVIYKLGNGVQLDKKHKDHALKGSGSAIYNLIGYWFIWWKMIY